MTAHDDDGDGAGRLLGREPAEASGSDNHVWPELYKLRGKLG